VCRDLSEIATYAKVSNQNYRLLKSLTPGAYTFILLASRETPKRLQNERRKTIGIRIPDHPVPQALLAELGEPLLSSTLLLPGEELPLTDAREIQDRLKHQVDAVIDGGNCGFDPTTVVDLEGSAPVLLRQGRGDVSGFM
jgi:tRNA threonylcarbamoyl adenosine modification protein (Sua5/YciO/YrdC/YwlC family)